MDRFERIYQLHTLLSGRRTPASNRFLQDKLECSESTIKRLVTLMRDHFDAPIICDRKRNGYYYDTETGSHPYELPGLWFNADELWGLLTCHRLLRDISHGIFGGPARHLARLKFTPERARWIADEQWHPNQTGRWLEDGSYELCIPFGDYRELLMDILKHGSNVEIIEPEFLS